MTTHSPTRPGASGSHTGAVPVRIREMILIAVAFAVLMLVLPATLSDFRLNLLSKFLCFAILAIGIDLIWGYAGMLSLGHGVWFGLGGYAVAMYLKLVAAKDFGDPIPDFMTWSGLKALPWFWSPFQHAWFAGLAVLIVPAALAFLLGMLVFRSRVKGAYFAIITQALTLSMSIFFVGTQEYTGGTNGLTSFSTIFGMNLVAVQTQHVLYYATCITLLVVFVATLWLTRSPFGRLLVAIRDDEERVRFAGHNVAVAKAVALAISALIAAVAGALYTPQVGIISPVNMEIVPSIEFVLFVAVGGRGTLFGAVVGALVVGATRSVFSEQFPNSWQYVYGGLFVGVVLLFPDGIVGGLHRLSATIAGALPGRQGRAARAAQSGQPARSSEAFIPVEAEAGGHPVVD